MRQNLKGFRLGLGLYFKKKEFIEGNRNSFIHLYACNANRYDFEMNDVINYAYSYSDNTLTEEEIERTIKSVYRNNVNERGSFAKPAKPAKPPNYICINHRKTAL